jgi:hypothetical protein
MAVFEISVNGKLRFVGEEISAITLSSNCLVFGKTERVYLHVGIGEAGDYEVQYLGGDLQPGDEVSIKVLANVDYLTDPNPPPEACSFCGTSRWDVGSLVAGRRVAICERCTQAFHSAIVKGAALHQGATIQDSHEGQCDFCQKSPPEMPGLVVRNATAICPECLHVCMDLTEDYQ